MTSDAVTEALGESLSPSQVTTYMTCPAKWYFRHPKAASASSTITRFSLRR
jgi:CRISPR/Cas system-associated exonuclease Cas4 (RecB family)